MLTKNIINECFHLDAIILFNKAKNKLRQKITNDAFLSLKQNNVYETDLHF